MSNEYEKVVVGRRSLFMPSLRTMNDVERDARLKQLRIVTDDTKSATITNSDNFLYLLIPRKIVRKEGAIEVEGPHRKKQFVHYKKDGQIVFSELLVWDRGELVFNYLFFPESSDL